ncbi:type I pullulanase [Butyrivibrio sp. YAB3001]|uniref:type I pullulanase n=1 Tax=Butyrivibrio sp. YAB3001 TaxID=1520812 RepID=UPI0008F61862|nr:type I pullulanase [Butyrivibrio sp. YAB3001]SFD03759.1 pullulanase [Butyrivibrio sp. YAB3001]
MKCVKKVLVSILAVAIIFALVMPGFGTVIIARADEGVTLKLHYHREDGDYSPWDVWMWPEGGEGQGIPLEEEDGDMVATLSVPAGAVKVGYIVRTQDWTKDVDMDQFIDLSEVVSGTVHAYVESGVEGAVKEYGDDVVTGTKLKSAVYDGKNTVTVLFTGELSKNQEKDFYVIGRLGEVGVNEVKVAEKVSDSEYYYDLTIEKKLEFNRNYRVGFENQEYEINMPIVYSTKEFEDKYTYDGDDLGATYSAEKTAFRVWAPTAEAVYVNLYETGDPWENNLKEKVEMTSDVNGTWKADVAGNLAGTYYTYTAVIDGLNVEACDPYARTTGVNGKRAMVTDLDATDPADWDKDTNPHAGEKINDAVIYELHVRDFSVSEAGGIADVGKYTAFTKTGTKTAGGQATGIDYLKDLGVTHIHILPFYDFGSVDENAPTSEQFNWGYDPVNYNVPEGSYSTDPYHGEVRVKEAKEMVKALHDNGLSVVMDVVYNHVYSGKDFCINRLVPGYFSRINADGSYSNGSGCGNDTASERTMVRKYIVDSVCYWADEYHIDGFRFDLVGLLDTDTINEIVSEVHKTHPDVIFYGEGWSMNTDVTKENVTLATQQSSAKTPGFAYFNDNIRDGLKGSVFNTAETGWASGSTGKERQMTSSFMAQESWSKEPSQIVQYASCHDNNTLIDRIATARTDLDRDSWVKMSNLAAAYYLTAEGIPFMQAGEEILRTKQKEDGTYDSNSYSSGDAINCIKWENLDLPEYQTNLKYYKGLIEFRKAHGLCRLSTAEEVAGRVSAIEGLDKNVIAFSMDNADRKVEGENAESILLIFNPNQSETTVKLPEGNWNVCVKGTEAGNSSLETASGSVSVAPISTLILTKGDETIASATDKKEDNSVNENSEKTSDNVSESSNSQNTGLIVGIIAVFAAAVAAVLLLFKKKK